MKDQHPQEWKGFLNDNAELIAALDETMRGMEPYWQLHTYYIDLYNKRRIEEADKIDHAIGHPLGIFAIGIFGWDQLNPLLASAAEKMRESGISPEDFYG